MSPPLSGPSAGVKPTPPPLPPPSCSAAGLSSSCPPAPPPPALPPPAAPAAGFTPPPARDSCSEGGPACPARPGACAACACACSSWCWPAPPPRAGVSSERAAGPKALVALSRREGRGAAQGVRGHRRPLRWQLQRWRRRRGQQWMQRESPWSAAPEAAARAGAAGRPRARRQQRWKGQQQRRRLLRQGLPLLQWQRQWLRLRLRQLQQRLLLLLRHCSPALACC